MNTHIIYATKTGHSKKIATAIGQQLNIPVSDVDDKPELENLDILFVVGGVYDGNSKPELLSFIKNMNPKATKRAALITSSANNDSKQIFVHKLLTEKGIDVIGENWCTSSFLFMNLFHPNKGDIERSTNFVKGILGISKYD